jgi:hypothetical protein
MDTLPNLSRDLVITPRLAHQEDDIPALSIGGSNADKRPRITIIKEEEDFLI